MNHITSSHLFSIRMLWVPPGRAGEFCPCICHHRCWVFGKELTSTSPPTLVGSGCLCGSPLNPWCKIPCPPCPDMKISIWHYSSSFLVAVETNLNETLVFWKRIWVEVICHARSHANSISILFDYGDVLGINSKSFCHHCILKEEEEKNLWALSDTEDLYCMWTDFWMLKALGVTGIFNLMAMWIACWKGPFLSLLLLSTANRLSNGQDSGF